MKYKLTNEKHNNGVEYDIRKLEQTIFRLILDAKIKK